MKRFFLMKSKISGAAIVVAVILMLAIIFPCAITIIWNGKIEIIDIKIHHSGYVVEFPDGKEMDMEEFIPCAIMAQLDYNTEDEAIKAQLVTDRTKIVKKMGEGNRISVEDTKLPYVTYEQLQEMYGSEFEKMYKRLVKLQNETNQSIITYSGKPISAYYHSVSAGATRNSDKEYIKSVESREDSVADNYLSIIYYTPDEFEAALKNVDAGIVINKENPMEGIAVTPEDDTGYVSEVAVGGIKVSGDRFYKDMGLSSPCFTIERFNEAIRIVVKGIGHGKGLSIYGAKRMAESGKSYKEILMYYYSGVQIEKCSTVQTSSNLIS